MEGFVKLWYFVAFKLLIFSFSLCSLLGNVSPVVSQLTLRRFQQNGKALLPKILISNKSYSNNLVATQL